MRFDNPVLNQIQTVSLKQAAIKRNLALMEYAVRFLSNTLGVFDWAIRASRVYVKGTFAVKV